MSTSQRTFKAPGKQLLLPLLLFIALTVGATATSYAGLVIRAKVGPAKVLITKRPAPVRSITIRHARPAPDRCVWVPGHYQKRPGRPAKWIPGHWQRVR
ncbi:MAG: YXWGXW repeat-containing protein [bacterium]